MERLTDRLANHPLREQIRTLRGHVEALSDETVAAADEPAAGAVARVPKALTYVEGVLAAADPELTTAVALDAIASALTNASNVASQLTDNPALAPQLEQHIEEALAAIGPLAVASPLIAERAGAATEAFDNALVETVTLLRERTEALSGELSALEKRRAEATTEQETAEQARRETFQVSIDALQASVDAEKARADELVATHQGKFDAAHQEQKDAFEALRGELKSETDATLSEFKQEAERSGEQLRNDAEAVLTEVRGRRDDVEQLYGVITDTSTTGAFRDEAAAQKTAADNWRKVAVGFGIAAAILAMAAIVLSVLFPDDATSTSAIIAKATATLVAAGIAAYAGRQSGRHREREEEAKRLELELVAFPPFIESLDDTQKGAVRKEFADRAFRGRPVEASSRGLFRKQDSFGVGLPELVDIIVTAVRKSENPA